MSKKSNLWRGTWGEIKSPWRALFIAPPFAALPVLPFLVIAGFRIPERAVEMGLLGIFMTVLLSYVITFCFGMPWFLLLSSIGWAGLVPVISFSFVPAWLARHGTGSCPDHWYLPILYLICGMCVSFVYWRTVRSSYDGPRVDWEQRFDASLSKLFRRKSG